MKRLTGLIALSIIWLISSGSSLGELVAPYQIQHSSIDEAYIDTPVPGGQVMVFFENPSLREAAINAGAIGAATDFALVAEAWRTADWEADTIPVPSNCHRVAMLTAAIHDIEQMLYLDNELGSELSDEEE